MSTNFNEKLDSFENNADDEELEDGVLGKINQNDY